MSHDRPHDSSRFRETQVGPDQHSGMSVLSDLIQSIIDMPGEFADVAAQGPIEGTLVLIGALLVVVPSIIFGYLVLGAAADLVVPDSSSRSYP